MSHSSLVPKKVYCKDKVWRTYWVKGNKRLVLYHGTTVEAANRIRREGFVPDKKYNWNVTSKPGFVYLSLAYAPFYAMMAKGEESTRALVKVSVEARDLYPDDDFVMITLSKPVYTQRDLDRLNMEAVKNLAMTSLEYMGNVCAKPSDIHIIGVKEFNAKGLVMVCDPCITPLNYQIMGQYYKDLTEWIYQGKNPLEFRGAF